MSDHNAMELMITVAARELEDGATVGVGTGAPWAAAMLAQKTGSPKLVIVFQAPAGPMTLPLWVLREKVAPYRYVIGRAA